MLLTNTRLPILAVAAVVLAASALAITACGSTDQGNAATRSAPSAISSASASMTSTSASLSARLSISSAQTKSVENNTVSPNATSPTSADISTPIGSSSQSDGLAISSETTLIGTSKFPNSIGSYVLITDGVYQRVSPLCHGGSGGEIVTAPDEESSSTPGPWIRHASVWYSTDPDAMKQSGGVVKCNSSSFATIYMVISSAKSGSDAEQFATTYRRDNDQKEVRPGIWCAFGDQCTAVRGSDFVMVSASAMDLDEISQLMDGLVRA